MTNERQPAYDPQSPLWWGINEDGTPDERKLKKIVDAIVRTAHPEQIVLFGSGAAGTMNAHSDLDLLVVMETTTPRATAQLLRDAAPPQSPPLDIVVARRTDVERTRTEPAFVTHDACEHGRLVYDARD